MRETLKGSMYSFLVTILISSALWANFTDKQIQSLQSKSQITYQDLAHENRGCPENSICSKEMGDKMIQWDRFMKSLDPIDVKSLEAYRLKHGIPVSFLIKKGGILGIDPILYKSRCAHHNPKDSKQAVFKGMQFFRNNPNSELVHFDSAWLGETKYELPFEDIPIMVKDKRLVVVRDHENKFFHLGIDEKGKWKVISPQKSEIRMAMQTIENTECEEVKPGALYLKTFCKKIWNSDIKGPQTIRLSWACH